MPVDVKGAVANAFLEMAARKDLSFCGRPFHRQLSAAVLCIRRRGSKQRMKKEGQ